MKKFIFTLIALLSVLGSNAQTVSSSSIQLKNDKSQTIAVKFDSNKTIFGLQFDVVLPDGVSLVAYNNNENFVDNFNTSVGGGYTTVYSNQIADNTYRFLLYCSNTEGHVYNGNLFNINVKMSSDATEGGFATIKNVFYTTTEPFYDEEYEETYDKVIDNIGTGSSFNVELVKPTYLTLDEASEASAYDVVSENGLLGKSIDNVTVKRTIKANSWSTLVLPFDMTASEIKANFGDDVALNTFTGFTPSEEIDSKNRPISVSMDIMPYDIKGGIEANKTYFVKVSQPVSTIEVKEKTLKFDSSLQNTPTSVVFGTVAGQVATATGYYSTGVIPSGALFLAGNKFYYSIGADKMKGFRSFITLPFVLSGFTIPGEESSAAKVFSFFDHEETTAIQDVDANKANDNNVYTLTGVWAGNDLSVVKPGLYIQNGKKVVVE